MLVFFEYSKTVVKNLILPPAGPLLLAGLGALCLGRWPRLGRAAIALALAALWLLSIPIVADQLERTAEHYPALDATAPTGAHAIVIIGGGGERGYAPEYRGPAADSELLAKLAYGAYLARRTALPVLLSGHQIEATAMRDSLERNFDIEPRWVDNQAYDTFENARNAAQLLRPAGIRRIILVTTSMHMWRAAHEFSAAGMQVVPAPIDGLSARDIAPFIYLPDVMALQRSYDAVYELLGERVREFLAVTHWRHQTNPAALPAAEAQ